MKLMTGFLLFCTALSFGQAAAQTDTQKQFVVLLNTLLEYREDEKFKQVGFGICCKYHDWLKSIERLENTAETLLPFPGHYFVIGDLKMVGLTFAKNGRKQTDYTQFIAAEICPAVDGLLEGPDSEEKRNLDRFCSGK